MSEIHLVEKNIHPQNLRLVDKEKTEWQSGYWAIAQETAEKLVGGYIYLHKGHDKPSHFGGEILAFEIFKEENSDLNNRVIFRFRASPEFKGVKTNKTGWGNEKKIVW